MGLFSSKEVVQEVCANCLYWLINKDRSVCRRYPPVHEPMEGPNRNAASFPSVGIGDWCGEYKKGAK